MLHSIVVSLSITFGSPSGAEFELTINPTLLIDAPLTRVMPSTSGQGEYWAVTLPHLILIDETAVPPAERARLLREESTHAEQWTALGPWYPIVWAFTLGEALEPYSPREFYHTGEMHLDWNRMWTPDEQLAQRCPLLRVANHNLSLLPCWAAQE